MHAHRNDIDGMRAICIVAVLMFHAGFSDWLGGYIGVDIFFVISGYLITSLIARQMSEGRFSLLDFYERRARRLMAATIPVVLFTTLVAWIFYTTGAFLEYSKSLIAFAAYVSNWFFLATTGYFGIPAASTPLLHTWSLAVEEQFYLVFPIFLLLLNRRKTIIIPVLIGIAVASLAYAQFEIDRGNTERAFFSLLSRFWELMAGAILALSKSKIGRLTALSTPMRAAGLAMIIAPVFLFGPTTGVPGLPTLIPVAGALLLLAASPHVRDPFLVALSAGPVVYLGRISYSLYLWHWPIMGTMRTVVLDYDDLHRILAIAMSIGAAALSYHYVEQPVRTRHLLPRKVDMLSLAAASALIAMSIGAFGWATGGWPGRFAPEVEREVARAAQKPADPDNCFKIGPVANDFCKIGARPGEPIDIVLWGDSHAAALLPAIRRYANEHGLSFAAALRADCLPLVGVWRTKDPTQSCRKFNDDALAFIRENQAKHVVLTARWQVYRSGAQPLLDAAHPRASRSEAKSVYFDAFARTFDALSGHSLLVIEQMPELHAELPSAYLLMQRVGLPASSVAATLESHRKRIKATVEPLDGLQHKYAFTRFDPAPVLCKDKALCTFQTGGNLLYYDEHHLNGAGSDYIYPDLATALDRWRAPPAGR